MRLTSFKQFFSHAGITATSLAWLVSRNQPEYREELLKNRPSLLFTAGRKTHHVAADVTEVPSSRPTFWQMLCVAVGTSALFVVAYSSTNWLSSQRANVGTWYYEWERWIPFVPLMIVPYMSIDLFFFAAPFLHKDRAELYLFARRIVFVIVVASLAFLFFPLRLAVERPVAEGWAGAIYNWFVTVDAPYNLCPSLHIALRTILAATYAFHTRGVVLIASHIWFSLIGISTLLTYQHHIVDLLGGFLLATVCFYLFRKSALKTPCVPNPSIGRLYASLAIVFIGLSLWIGGWGLWLLWPACSSAVVACGYFGFGAGIYRKQQGRIPLASRLVLGPQLVGQYLSWVYYRRQCQPWDAVTPNVWIGRRLTIAEAAFAQQQGVTAVLDLTAEFSAPQPFLQLHYFNLPVLDLTAPTPAQLRQAVEFIERESARGVVYVHCKIGYSRSAAMIAAWLLASERVASVEAAYAQLRSIRPSIVIRPEIQTALKAFAADQTASG